MASGITTTRVVVASTAELQAAIAAYTAQGYQLKATSETTASMERMRSAYEPFKMGCLLLLCIIPGIIYGMRNPPTKQVGEVVLIQVEVPT